MMFCICSTKMAKTLRAVLVSMSSMSELLLERVADAGQHRLGDVAAIGEDDSRMLQLGCEGQTGPWPASSAPSRRQRDKANNGDVVAPLLLTLVLGEGGHQSPALLCHRAAW